MTGETKKKAGRPPKAKPADTSELRITIPTHEVEYIKQVAAVKGMEPGTLVRKAIETHVSLGDRLEKIEADMNEVRSLHSSILTSLDRIGEFIARRERDYRIALAGGDTNIANEVFADDVMDVRRDLSDFEDLPFEEGDR
ncbi:hypothetical protein [Rhizobium sp. WYCCWR 11146]|uniref:hypothetical protein n=1 Tax=Rhizobium sp. WYCCWR 11146 TaxID=2749833 RepID=UPI0015E77403|nr:hypothetical protein [Rhizobium sp. WYCCWR 11146]MBA1343932.1 hypothetical protein [Rhizobium sp. WYCCWR 11146]